MKFRDIKPKKKLLEIPWINNLWIKFTVRRTLTSFLMAFFVLLFCVSTFGAFMYGMMFRQSMAKKMDQWFLERGHPAEFAKYGLRKEFSKVLKLVKSEPSRLLGPKSQSGDLPSVDIVIKYKHLYKLYNKRALALKNGVLLAETEDFVPANLDFNGEKLPIKIRLKGDMNNHLEGKKWSFRIKMKDKGQFLGLRVFSFQHPKTRGYQWEPVFYKHLSLYGGLVPRYEFLRVSINGDDIGVMALEEHFSKELLERQESKEAPIIRFDETLIKAGTVDNTSGVHSGFNTLLKPFLMSKILKTSVLYRNMEQAISYLRGWQEGKLPLEAVFNLQKLAAFMAACELWDAKHGMYWTNMRFYFNPITSLLEPVAFDNNSLHFHTSELMLNSASGIFPVTKFLEDKAFREVFVQTLHGMAKDVLEGGVVEKLAQFDQQIIKNLRPEFNFISGMDYSLLRERAKILSHLTVNNMSYLTRSFAPVDAHTPFTQSMNALLVKREKNYFLEIQNILPFELSLKNAAYSFEDVETKQKSERTVLKFNDVLLASRYQETPLSKMYQLNLSESEFEKIKNEEANLIVEASRGSNHYAQKTLVYFEGANENDIPYITEEEFLSRKYDFIKTDVKNKRIVFRTGKIFIEKTLSFPRDYEVVIPAGTELRFAANQIMTVFGPLQIQGTEKAPVLLTSKDEGRPWRGLLLMRAKSPSYWTYAKIRNTDRLRNKNWELTGAVAVVESTIKMEHVEFDKTVAEDALNIIRSTFVLSDVTIQNTLSDAFDSDFSKGQFIRGKFKNIKGDGIDVSGTQVTVDGTRFEQIQDKAISVGEKSQLQAVNVSIKDCATGMVAKDRSEGEITHSKLENIKYVGLMAYTKKAEYGPGTLKVKDVQITGAAKDMLSQKGSVLYLDGKKIDEEDVDIDKLYKTGYMKK